APGRPGGSAARIRSRSPRSNGMLTRPRYRQSSTSPSSSRSAQATSMPSTDVPDMQPRTRIARFGEAATGLDATIEDSNLVPSRPAWRRAGRMPTGGMVQPAHEPEHQALMPASPRSRTEERNERTREIDTVPTLELLAMLNAEDAVVAGAVRATLPVLAVVVDLVVERLRDGGRVHYFGAGSSGRIGVVGAGEGGAAFGAQPRGLLAH